MDVIRRTPSRERLSRLSATDDDGSDLESDDAGGGYTTDSQDRQAARGVFARTVAFVSSQDRRTLAAVVGAVMAVAVVAVVVWVNRIALVGALDTLARWLRANGVLGIFVVVLILSATAFPPMIGYSTLLTLCGYVWGFPLGFVPGFLGGFIGSSLCFIAARRYLRQYVERKVLVRFPNVNTIKRVIERRGFKFLLLIRIAPYPYNIVNVLVATTRIPYRVYAAATAISLLKILIHIYLGASLTNFTELVLPAPAPGAGAGNENNASRERATVLSHVFLGVGFACAVVGIVWVWRVVQRAVKDEEEVQMTELAGGGEFRIPLQALSPPPNNASGSTTALGPTRTSPVSLRGLDDAQMPATLQVAQDLGSPSSRHHHH
ncbi:Tlg2-vesicle protein [Sorochytrium milnesiophthora]